jgi:predicted PurR-regulated permease PerM
VEPILDRAPGLARAVTPFDRAAWLLGGVALLFVFLLHLVPGLVAGLLVHLVLRRLEARLAGLRFSSGRAKLIAASGVGALAVILVSALVLALVGLVQGRWGGLPDLFAKMAQALDETSSWLEARGIPALLPDVGGDTGQLKEALADWLRTHGETLRRTGGEVGRGLLHVAVGMAVGVLVFFRHAEGSQGPLARALAARVRRFADAFDTVVLAQVKISLINTGLTALYLLVGLRLFGVRLPLAGTLVVVTFLTGLLPVVGNLVSNTVIVLISLGVSGWVGLASLVFLVVIHKLEYAVNARIVAGQIHASAWEILLALFAFEAAFGLPGVVLAPIVYAGVKGELQERGLV